MRTLDLDSLAIFCSVVREGGVVRAAASLHRVPSNVSTRLRQLEERLGQPLFHRRGRGLALLPAGAALLPYAERLLALADEAERSLAGGAQGGVLRLGSLESTAGSRLAPVLSRFHRSHPGVVVELSTGTTGALLDRLGRYALDAAFVSEPFDTPPGCTALPVFDEELVLITAAHAAAVRRAPDLAGSTLIAFAAGCSYRRRIEEWLAGAGSAPARTLEIASYQAMIACVAAGTGVALVPRSLLTALRATRTVRQHAVPPRVRRNRTHLVWQGAASPALQRLQAVLAG